MMDESVEEYVCWCGARGRLDEMHEELPLTCGGDGYLHCDCGGEFCVCHWHGGTECPGCEECDGDEGWDDYGDEE